MNILQVNTSDTGGGAEKRSVDIYRELNHQGHLSWLAVGKKRSEDREIFEIPRCVNCSLWDKFLLPIQGIIRPYIGQVYGAGHVFHLIEMVRVPSHFIERFNGHEDFEYPGAWHLLSLPSQPPDILHCHNLHGNYFDLRALPYLSHQVPTVLTLRDAWLFSGHCAHSFDCERWKTGCGDCPDLSIYPAIRKDATAYNWQRKAEIYKKSRLHIVTPSQWLMDKVEQSILKPGIVSSKVIPNGVDLKVFHPVDLVEARKELGLAHDLKILLFTANGIRNNIWKDYQTLRRVIKKIAQTEEKVLCIALGENAPMERIGSVEIQFIPYQRDETMVARYYQASDLYLHPARVDTFPGTILEALACGTPAVASAVGGIPEQIIEGKTGHLIPVGDADSMAERIHTLLSDDELRYEMGERAAEDAMRRFGLERMVREYSEFYNKVIE